MIRCNCTWQLPGVTLLVTFPDHPGRFLAIEGHDELDTFFYGGFLRCDPAPTRRKYFDESDIIACPDKYLEDAAHD